MYDYKILASRLRELAYLNAGLRISLTDRRVVNEEDGSFKSEVFYSEEGLREFVRFIESSREHLINDVIYLNSEKQGIPIEIAIMYNTGFSENVHSYVNNINTIEGGTHLAGFRRALTRTLKKYAEDSKMLEKVKVEISGDDFREGLTAVISVKVAEPQFEGQTKTKLGNNEVMGAVDQAVGEATHSTSAAVSSSAAVSVLPLSEKNMVMSAMSAGKRPLHGMRLLVSTASSRSRSESMIRQPTTPAALQPSPMHIVSACLPQARHA